MLDVIERGTETDDALTLFLREIRSYPLLTAEDVVSLDPVPDYVQYA